ncbi:MAG: phosphoribulokinase [Rhodospirillales bacterium]|jgi:phosphoribulokinase|nr:phosphoribulokinase [Rhodospirillales bacterium]MBT4038543.1 phosphoribulokinase [Rhodospirillales bacterium]MBT4628330.1 phosphoribulokinase [Rhodospirillales bacterium]MBT5350611.1 phosphoribulokinase [Rhodospirillales bacterium]MBT5522089.1 phosphoribulokinase [Rhodospirillales bacterium]
MPHNRLADRPIILGIVGDSAAGKTTLTKGIATMLGDERVVTICTDDYHRYDRTERRSRGITALDPVANHMDILEQHIQLLRQGRPILKPVYNHEDGTLAPAEYIQPREYIIIEGLLGYTTRAMRDCYDVKVYLEPVEDLRVRWKIDRDTSTRGYTRDDVVNTISGRSAAGTRYIHPQRTFADMVVHFFPPEENEQETGAGLSVRHTWRPTLPHPDLSPIIEAGAKAGIKLELSRDTDGKPVDVLDIQGDIDGRRAGGMEDLLWNLIPEAQYLRDELGRFDVEDKSQISHTLALSQLLITYHIVKAALGHHAV